MHQKIHAPLNTANRARTNTSLNQDYIVVIIYERIKDCFLMIHYRKRSGFWFPFNERENCETSIQTVGRILDRLSIDEYDQIHLFKVCSAKTLPCRARDVLFYCVTLKPNGNVNVLCNGRVDSNDFDQQVETLSDNAHVWLNNTQLKYLSKKSQLLGIEPISLHKQLKDIFHNTMNPSKRNSSTIFEEVHMPNVRSSSTVTLSSAESLIMSAKFTETIQQQIYQEYLDAALPSEYLNFRTFEHLMANKGLDSASNLHYFRAFDSMQRNYLTFIDYLLGLAALDPSTQHGGLPAEQRCRYIFRYYNAGNNQRMSFDEFKCMIEDIHKSKGLTLTSDNLNEEASRMFRAFGLRSLDQSLNLINFLSAVGQLKFRGTSVLFRLSKSINQLVKLNHTKSVENPANVARETTLTNKTPSLGSIVRRAEKVSISTNTNKDQTSYEIATHIVKVCCLLE